MRTAQGTPFKEDKHQIQCRADRSDVFGIRDVWDDDGIRRSANRCLFTPHASAGERGPGRICRSG